MSFSSNFPTIAPSLNLDFANTKVLDPRITLTRASTATFYDGLTVAKAEENLLTYSQEFENSVWENPNSYVSITANTTTAPDGTTTADTIAQTAVNNYFLIQQNKTIAANTTYVFSTHVKNVDINYVTIELYGANSNFAYAEFNLSTGALSRSSATGTGWSLISTAIQAVGASGWYRISAVITAGTTVSTPRQRIFLTDGTTAISATTGLSTFAGTSLSAYLWGAQLEQRSAVTAYTATTTQPITNYIPVLRTAAAGVARYDHNPTTGESLGLLIEEQRANLLNNSNDFQNNTYWTKTRSTISDNSIVSPDGTQNADKLVETATTGTHACYNVTVIALTAQAYTWSVYMKAGERTWGVINAYDGASHISYFDLANGVTGNNESGNTSTITNVGNGWYRCTVTRTAAVTANGQIEITTATANGTNSYAGDITKGIYVWGAQLEAGAFPTSYIPTVASSVTRAADNATITGTNFSSWYRPDEGTLYAEWSQAQTASTTRVFQVDDGSSNNRIYVGGSSIGATTVVANNATQAALGIGAVSANTFVKVVGCYKVNDFAMSTNASSVSTDTSGIVPTVDRARIGVSEAAFSVNGTIKKLAYYPLRLTNAQLQALTS